MSFHQTIIIELYLSQDLTIVTSKCCKGMTIKCVLHNSNFGIFCKRCIVGLLFQTFVEILSRFNSTKSKTFVILIVPLSSLPSSMNIIFYGVFNQQFRLTAQKLFLKNLKLCQRRDSAKNSGFSTNNKRPMINGRFKRAAETAV